MLYNQVLNDWINLVTMHLEGPWLSTTGKVKSKRRRYASADAARKARELQAMWEVKQQEWAKLAPNFSKTISRVKTTVSKSVPSLRVPPGRETPHYPSVETGGGNTARPADKFYTGTLIKGIGTMHKSNAVPIFSDQEAKDISSMRR